MDLNVEKRYHQTLSKRASLAIHDYTLIYEKYYGVLMMHRESYNSSSYLLPKSIS